VYISKAEKSGKKAKREREIVSNAIILLPIILFTFFY